MKYSKELTAKLCEKLRKGLSRDDSCYLVNLSHTAFYEWMADPKKADFADSIKKAEAEFKETNLYIIQKAGVKSWQAAGWLMERRYPKEFALQMRTEVTGRGGSPLIPHKPSVDLSGLTKAQLDALIISTISLPIPPELPKGNGNGNGHPESH